MIKQMTHYIKKDIVLTSSLLLAIGSALIVPPSIEYIDYIDFDTLILLFSLMLIVEGLREQSFFEFIGDRLLKRVKTRRGLSFTLIFLPFVSSMFITNDVALITFVPFALLILEKTGTDTKLCYTISLMTIAGNLGSMFTPIGNPQNLYLFSMGHIHLSQFLYWMFPYTLFSAVLLFFCVWIGFDRTELSIENKIEGLREPKTIILYVTLFFFALLTVAGIVPHVVLLLVVISLLGTSQKIVFKKIDYSLLLTFLFFFLFIGNFKQLDGVQEVLLSGVANHERAVSILSSQIISNVPAAMLLSGYTTNFKEIIIGTNIGGLGTLIASMASLISYKQLASKHPQLKKRYIIVFTVCNLVFLFFLCFV